MQFKNGIIYVDGVALGQTNMIDVPIINTSNQTTTALIDTSIVSGFNLKMVYTEVGSPSTIHDDWFHPNTPRPQERKITHRHGGQKLHEEKKPWYQKSRTGSKKW